MGEERKEMEELKKKIDKIEQILMGKISQPSAPVAEETLPWEKIINRPGPPITDPYHQPPDVFLAQGQRLIYKKLLLIYELLERILSEVKK